MPKPISELSDKELLALSAGVPPVDQLGDDELLAVAVHQGQLQDEEAGNLLRDKKAAERAPVADAIAETAGPAFAPLAKVALTKGGRVGDFVAGVVAPITGSIIGGTTGAPTVAGLPTGVMAGGAAGATAGEALVQARQFVRGERDTPSRGRLIGAAAAGAVPFGQQVPKLLNNILRRGTQGALVSTAAEGLGQLVDEGKLDLPRLAESGALGFILGGATGAGENAVLRRTVLQQIRRTPEFANFKGSDSELVDAVRAKMAAGAPEPKNVTPAADPAAPALPEAAPVQPEAPTAAPVPAEQQFTQLAGLEPRATVPPAGLGNLGGAVETAAPAGSDNLPQTEPPAAPPPISTLTHEELIAQANALADQLQAPAAVPEPQLPAVPAGVVAPSSGSAEPAAVPPPDTGGQAPETVPAPAPTVTPEAEGYRMLNTYPDAATAQATMKAGKNYRMVNQPDGSVQLWFKPKGAGFKIGDPPDGGSDLLTDIAELGGIAQPKGKSDYGFDGFADAFGKGQARLLRRRGAQSPDALVEELNSLGKGYAFDGPDQLYQAVIDAAAQRVRMANDLKRLEHESKIGAALLENTGRPKTLTAPKPVSVDTLNPGDTFKVHGEQLKVIAIDPETNAVTVRNGGEFRIPAGSPIYPDKGRVKRMPKAAPTEDMPFEDPVAYGNAQARYTKLRALEKDGKLDAAGQAELDNVERTLGQDFLDFYSGEKQGAATSLADEAQLKREELQRKADARLQAPDLQSQSDLFGPATDKAGQFSLFENTVTKYLDARQLTTPPARAAVRGILAAVWERRLARQLELDLATDGAIADTIDAPPVSRRVGGPDAGHEGGGLGRSVDRLPDAQLGIQDWNRSGLQLEARLYTQAFLADGFLAHTGRKFENVAQLISAAQVLRNRNVETFWLLPYDAEGRLLQPFAFSSRLPNTVNIGENYVERFDKLLRGVGAKTFDILHNHPSGDPVPSRADREFTAHIALAMPTMRTHYIINHGTYSVIKHTGEVWHNQVVPDIIWRPDPTEVRQGQNPYLGASMSAATAINIGYQLQVPARNVTLFFVNAGAIIVGTGSASVWDVTAAAFPGALRELARGVGAVDVFAYHDGETPEIGDALRSLKTRGMLTDLITTSPRGLVREGTPKRANLYENTPTVATRVAEESPDYAEADPSAPTHFVSSFDKTPVPQPLGQMSLVRPVEMPELVNIVKQLAGSIPSLKRLPRAHGYHRAGQIVLDRRIFSDVVFAQQVLAHELGHLVDFLPDQTMKRGNLLGRLLTLRNHLANTFGATATTNKELRDELKAVSFWWRPFDAATASDSFAAYRNSSKEIYADALSVLFNAPAELRQRAPKAWKLFFDELDRKPEAKAALFETWDLLHQGAKAVSAVRLGNVHQGFAQAEEILLKKAAERDARRNSLPAIVENFKQKHFNIYAPIIERARQARAAGARLKWSEDPEFVFDAHPFAENANYRFLDRVQKGVVEPLEGLGIDQTALGDYLFFNRIARESYLVGEELAGRGTIANPHGHTAQTARRELLVMRYRLGPKRFEAMQISARRFQDLALEVIERGHAAGIYSDAQLTLARQNRYNYAAFAVVDFLEQSPHIPAAFRQQSGTLRAVANPFLATVIKMMTATKFAELNLAKRSAVKLLADHFPGEIALAPVLRVPLANGKMLFRPKPPPQGKRELVVLEQGKPRVWHVDPEMADMFEHTPPASAHAIVGVTNWAFRNIFYPAFITYNPAFQLYANPIRDLSRSYVKLPPGVQRRHWLGAQLRAARSARARLLNDVQGADLQRRRDLRALAKRRPLTEPEQKELQLLDDRALAIEVLVQRGISTPFEAFASNPIRGDVWGQMLADYRLAPGASEHTAALRRWAEVVPGLGRALDKIEFAGQVSEAMPKLGAYRVLTRELGWTPEQAAYFIRNHVGTPNFTKRGKWTSWDGTIFPFINIFMRGLESDAQQATGRIPGVPIAAKEQRYSYWRRMAERTLIPRLLQALGAAGLLGVGIKKYYDAWSDYNKANYLILPLGTVHDGKGEFGYKSAGLRIPEDETARMLGGVLHYLVQSAATHNDPAAKASLGNLVNFAGGQVPGINPVLTLADGWTQYASGINPRDRLRGNPVLTQTEFAAGGWHALGGMVAWTWDEVGGGNFVRFDPKANTWQQHLIGGLPILSRAVKITDAGLRERQQTLEASLDARNARLRLAMPDNVNHLLGEYSALNGIRKENRTPQQMARLAELSYWHAKIWTPNYQMMQDSDERTWKPQGEAIGDISKAFEKR